MSVHCDWLRSKFDLQLLSQCVSTTTISEDPSPEELNACCLDANQETNISENPIISFKEEAGVCNMFSSELSVDVLLKN